MMELTERAAAWRADSSRPVTPARTCRHRPASSASAGISSDGRHFFSHIPYNTFRRCSKLKWRRTFSHAGFRHLGWSDNKELRSRVGGPCSALVAVLD